MESDFDTKRTEFLQGKEEIPSVKDSVMFHSNLGLEQNSSHLLKRADEQGQIVLQGNYSYSTLEEHKNFYTELAKSISNRQMIYTLTIDSAEERTRNLQDVSLDQLRNFVSDTPAPIQIRSGKSDQRLLAEKAFAAGISDIMGSAITNSAYSFERISLEKGLQYWKYVDDLISLYNQKGAAISKEISLPLTGNLIPPSLQISLVILDGLISLENGVKNFTLAYNQGGNLVQDISALKLLPELFREYAVRLDNVTTGQDHEEKSNGLNISSTLATWSAGFPDSPEKGYAIITMAGMVGAFGDSAKIITTSPQRGQGNPSSDSYIQGMKTTIQSIDMISSQEIESLNCTKEYSYLRKSVISIVEKVLEQLDEHNRTVSDAVLKSFKLGILDVPFSSMVENSGYVLPFRALDGSVRYFDCGNLPLPDEVVQYNEVCLNERATHERREPAFQMVIDDIYAAGKGQLR